MKKRTEKECEAEMREIRERLVPIVTASLTIGDYKLGNTIMDCPEVLKLFLENDPTCLLMYETMTPLDPSYGLSIGDPKIVVTFPPQRGQCGRGVTVTACGSPPPSFGTAIVNVSELSEFANANRCRKSETK